MLQTSIAPPPQLIVFEGADAVGKSTVCNGYMNRLGNLGIPATLMSFPGKIPGTIGEFVYQLHHDPKPKGVEKLTTASLQALHIAAHLDAIESTIIPCLNAGKTVVLDRYWWSTRVYGIVDGVNANVLDALVDAERVAWGRWRPSVVFHVTRSTPLRDEPMSIWQSLCQEYDALAKREASHYRVQELSNNGTLEDTISSAIASSHGS